MQFDVKHQLAVSLEWLMSRFRTKENNIVKQALEDSFILRIMNRVLIFCLFDYPKQFQNIPEIRPAYFQRYEIFNKKFFD